MIEQCQFILSGINESVIQVIVDTDIWDWSIKPYQDKPDLSQSDNGGVPEINNLSRQLCQLVDAGGTEIGVVKLGKTESCASYELVIYAGCGDRVCSYDKEDYSLGSFSSYRCELVSGVWRMRIGITVPNFIAYLLSSDWKFLKYFLDEVECHCVTDAGQRIVLESLAGMMRE